jgi:hypothetical protein
MSRFRLIACNVFQRELSIALGASRHIVDPEFLELGLHERADNLRATLQQRIDEASRARAPGGEPYDAILLAYGLCGNGTAGLEARNLPIVMPRAHDCCTVLLGSRAALAEYFGDSPSASWSSAGYVERGATYFRSSVLGQSSGIGLEYTALVEQYGEENAAYVWETLHPELHETTLRYIETPETAHLGFADLLRDRAAAEGKDFLLIPGSSRLLRALVDGEWDPDEFLVVPPGGRIEPAWDLERVVQVASDPGKE